MGLVLPHSVGQSDAGLLRTERFEYSYKSIGFRVFFDKFGSSHTGVLLWLLESLPSAISTAARPL